MSNRNKLLSIICGKRCQGNACIQESIHREMLNNKRLVPYNCPLHSTEPCIKSTRRERVIQGSVEEFGQSALFEELL